ncbi:hypothetical protein ACFV2S_10300 [Streptomyces sp. NPDC059695]|uniref:hypothetical protein n=1 Tax=Streptomyces sp. NPDC059695 TaxID=3346910 RepID=UPI00368D4B65
MPAQRSTAPTAPQIPPRPSAPPGAGQAGHGGHARHAAPAPQDPGQDAHRADGAEHRPDPVRPDGAAGVEQVPDLLDAADEEAFRTRWHEVQARFVDDPRQAVHDADVLVGDVMRNLADTFARHRHALEGEWSQGLEADTESLRRALCQYRALLHRLLSA